MPGKWDTSTKRLVGEHPEDFIRWLVPGANFQGKAKARPLNLNDREIEADNLMDPEVLQGLILKVVAAQKEEEAKQVLLSTGQTVNQKKRKK